MSRLLIANLGTSDFQYKGGTLKNNSLLDKLEGISNFVEAMNYAKENYEDIKEDIKLPILETLIKELSPNKLALVYTKQEPANKKDTYILFEIIERYLKEKYEIKEIVGFKFAQNPTSHEYLIAFLRGKILKNVVKKIEEYEKIYVSVTGGTPQMNEALILTLFNYELEEYIRVYQVIEKPGGDSYISANSFVNLLTALNAKTTLKTVIKNYDFKSAADLIDKWGEFITKDLDKIQILKYLSLFAENLLNFKFKEARENRNDNLLSYAQIKDIVNNFEPENESWKIVHFIDVLEVFIELKKWIDFAARNYAFCEALISRLLDEYFKKEKNFDFQTDSGRPTDEFIEFYREKKSLQSKLEESLKGKPEISKEKELSLPLKYCVYDALQINKDVSEILDKMIRFNITYRNKSHIAHGYGAVTEENFKELLDENDYKRLRKAIASEEKDRFNKFRIIKEKLMNLIE